MDATHWTHAALVVLGLVNTVLTLVVRRRVNIIYRNKLGRPRLEIRSESKD